MSRIIAIANPKGGTAKTVTALSLCSALAHTGRKVLLCDLDPQGFAGAAMGIKRPGSSPLGDALLDDKPLSDSDLLKLDSFDLLQGCEDLTALQAKGPLKRLCPRLKHVLEPVEDNYDFIFIDCPPTMGILTLTGLCAADFLIIPTHCEMLSIQSIDTILKECRRLKDQKLSKILLLGIVRTMFDENSSSEFFNKACADLKKVSSLTFNTIIPYSQSIIAACAGSGNDMFFNKQSKGLKAYMMLAGEILQKLRRLKEQSEMTPEDLAKEDLASSGTLPKDTQDKQDKDDASSQKTAVSQDSGAQTAEDAARVQEDNAHQKSKINESAVSAAADAQTYPQDQSLRGQGSSLQEQETLTASQKEPSDAQDAVGANKTEALAQDGKESQAADQASAGPLAQDENKSAVSSLQGAGPSTQKDNLDEGKSGTAKHNGALTMSARTAAAFAGSDTLQRLIRRAGLNQQRIKDHALGLRVMRRFDDPSELDDPFLHPPLGIASFKRPDAAPLLPKVNPFLQNEAASKSKTVSLESPLGSAQISQNPLKAPAMMRSSLDAHDEKKPDAANEEHAQGSFKPHEAAPLPKEPAISQGTTEAAPRQVSEAQKPSYPSLPSKGAVPERPGRRQARAALDKERGALNSDDLEVLAAIATLDQSEVRSTLQEQRQRQRQRQQELLEDDFDPLFDDMERPREYTIDDLDALKAQVLEEKREDLIKEQTLQFERTLNLAWDDATKITRQSTQAVQDHSDKIASSDAPAAKEEEVDWEEQFYEEEHTGFARDFTSQDNHPAAIEPKRADNPYFENWGGFDDDLKVEEVDDFQAPDDSWTADDFNPGLDDFYQEDDPGFEDLSADEGIEALDDDDEAVEILYDPASQALTGNDAADLDDLDTFVVDDKKPQIKTKPAKPRELLAGQLTVEDFERMLSEP